MRTFIEYALYGIVVFPAVIVLTEVLDVAVFPAMGVVLLVSTTTAFVSALIRDTVKG